MVIGYTDENECNFAIKFDDETKADEVKKAIQIGIGAWYEAAHDDIQPNEYWDKEDIEGFYRLSENTHHFSSEMNRHNNM